MRIASFWLFPLNSIGRSVGQQLWEKQQHDAIQSARTLETIWYAAWYKRRKDQSEHFRVIGCQSLGCAIWGRKYRERKQSNMQSTLRVFVGITIDGKVIRLFIFPLRLTLIKQDYIMCPENVVLLEDRMLGNRNLHCAESSRLMLSWMSFNICDHISNKIWPLDFLVSNPLDHYARGVVE